MSDTKTVTLDEAVAAVRQLPEDTQAAVAEELVALPRTIEPPV